jgi:pimeloyl-[acyl-carrier protein] methyl ester esterase
MPYLTVADDRKIYFEHHLGKRVPVLLIHGWGMSTRIWDVTASALIDAGHAVILFDQRGSGLSDKDFAENSIAQSAQDTAALVEHLRIDRVVLNGWSLGGAIAVAAADRIGPACVGLVLTTAATPRYVQSADFPHGGAPGSTAQTVKILRQDRVNFLAALTKAVYAVPQSAAVESWLWSVFMQTSHTADSALMDLDSLDQREILAKIEAPVLSIVGGKDVFVAPEIGRIAARIAKRGQLVEFPHCGHAPFLEDWPAYQSALFEFLQIVG